MRRTATIVVVLSVAALSQGTDAAAPEAAAAVASVHASGLSNSRAEFGPAAGKVDVCHNPATDGRILEIGLEGLAGHLAHGDYISTLLVSHEFDQPADGARFATITDALAAAGASRLAAGETVAAACRITILVAAGTFWGTVE